MCTSIVDLRVMIQCSLIGGYHSSNDEWYDEGTMHKLNDEALYV
jgi:hypothetical protein